MLRVFYIQIQKPAELLLQQQLLQPQQLQLLLKQRQPQLLLKQRQPQQQRQQRQQPLLLKHCYVQCFLSPIDLYRTTY
ncbi:unnamed protein product [Rotaria sp. Silwood2]|nr:unnamed protein product [Rotaria sp. Silwood2]CAF4420459.1 unnamed protein product [Rotaria sp. Silwood2]